MIEGLFLGRMNTPIGELLVVFDDNNCLRAVDWTDHSVRMHTLLRRHWGECELRDAPLPVTLANALQAYFAGQVDVLEALPVKMHGTLFQQQVWATLRTIPPGQTLSYSELS